MNQVLRVTKARKLLSGNAAVPAIHVFLLILGGMHTFSLQQHISVSFAAKNAIQSVISDAKLLQSACKINPWFSPFYIRSAGEALQSWMEEKTIEKFLSQYAGDKKPPKKIAVIMAANLPFVGFQDLFQVFLSGNICLYKFSSRDSVLMQALLEKWIELAPEIQPFFQPLTDESTIDFVVATGSDNTARYTGHKYRICPALIRKNRFSVAVLSGNETEIELNGLASDILLFNGMGCRNVSNLLVHPGFDMNPLLNTLEKYPEDKLSDAWKKRMKWECAIAEMLPFKNIVSRNAIIQSGTELKSVAPGYLNVVECETEDKINILIAESRNKIQCVVGNHCEVAFGKSQQPALDDFADGVDLIAEIRKI